MTRGLRSFPLRWRLFLASSTTITFLFAAAGWGLQRYGLRVADESVRSEIRSSMQAYDAVWTARTQLLSATTAVMSSMSDVRAAFMTRDPKTIRDSAGEIWSRVSDSSAVFLVLSPTGGLIASLGKESDRGLPTALSEAGAMNDLSKQRAGYVKVNAELYYVVLTPVYVQTSAEPVLLNVLCAGFPIDSTVVQQLHQTAPASDFAFADASGILVTTLPKAQTGEPLIVSRRKLNDLRGRPVAELRILRGYDSELNALAELRRFLALVWLLTIAVALFVSSYLTRRLLAPVKALDHAAGEIASGNYDFRVSVNEGDEFGRLAATFNHMCNSVQRAQAELRVQEQMATIGRLGTSLVHDLRNPLAAIYGGAEMLMDGHMPHDQARRIAGIIYKASHRIQELLRDLVNVSKAGGRSLEVCRLRDVLDAASDSVTGTLPGPTIDIHVSEFREIVTDRTRVERVFANLFSNAQQATSDSGSIAVYEREDREWLDVFVQDSGTGVPEHIRRKLFEPFVTGKRNGLGLGLALARRTMIELGGDLSLVDGSGGACFRVRLPNRDGKSQEPAIAEDS